MALLSPLESRPRVVRAIAAAHRKLSRAQHVDLHEQGSFGEPPEAARPPLGTAFATEEWRKAKERRREAVATVRENASAEPLPAPRPSAGEIPWASSLVRESSRQRAVFCPSKGAFVRAHAAHLGRTHALPLRTERDHGRNESRLGRHGQNGPCFGGLSAASQELLTVQLAGGG